MAFQKPITIQGRVTANNMRIATSTIPKPPADSASAIKASIAAMVATNKAANSTRRPVMIFPARVVSASVQRGAFQHAVTASDVVHRL